MNQNQLPKVAINVKVHEILAKIRKKLVELNPKQTGANAFQKFNYYQLSDFLPFVIKLAHDYHLSYQETFGKEEATLTLIDIQSGSSVTFSIPIDYSLIKGGSPMQSIGAAVTYARRYLWVSALGLTDHDLLDQMDLTEPTTIPKKEKQPTADNAIMKKLESIQKQNLEKRGNANDS